MNPCCVLTGHFLAPPGQDPWTGLRYDYSPTENFLQQWVRRNRSCYGANSASRILTSEGRIRDIVNNYQHLNFSVSPALLAELSRSSPNVYRRMREGDAASLERWGHGNALARPWTEAILPLLPPDRVEVQIDWGLEAFQSHFGRPAEGICLPHDAVNSLVLDVLVARGLKFLLLSSRQAEGTMPLGTGSWTSLGDAPAPGDRAFQIDRPGGSLAVFFPDERLSRGLLSDQLLRDAGRLDAALRQALQATGFTSVATNGESYGLQEPFADMCLAALWEKLGGASPVDCANYGYVLEHRPPAELVKLRKGDDEGGTSADCVHGVGRWHRECGCRSSNTQQKWKDPLWTLVSSVEASLKAETEASAQAQGVPPDVLRNRLPSLLLGTEAPRAWARSLLGVDDIGREDKLLRTARCLAGIQSLQEATLWEGDDPTSPEGREGLLRILRTLELAEGDVIETFVSSLDAVLVNDGRTLGAFVRSEILRRRHGPRFAAALLLLDRLLRPRAKYENAIGPLSVVDFSRSRHEIDEEVFRYTGQIVLEDREADRRSEFDYLLLEDHKEGVSLYLKDGSDAGKPEAFDLQQLPIGDRKSIVRLMGNDLESNLASETQAIFPLLRKSLVYARLFDVPPLPVARSLMELAVTRKILGLTEGSHVPDEQVFQELEEELDFARDFALTLDRDRLNRRFSRWLAQALGTPEDFTSEEVVRSVETLLAALGRWGFDPDLTVAQTLVFEALAERAPRLMAELEQGRLEALQELKRLIRLGTLLWIDTSDVKDRVLEL